MKIKITLLNQYVWRQLIFLFIASVGLLATLAVALGTISDLTYKISEYNLPLIIAVEIFLLKIPEYTTYALPIALLLTSILLYGRLNNNSELIAFFSFGINIYSLVIPVILFSIVVTGATFLLNEFIVPTANYKVAELEKVFITQTKTYLYKKDIFYPEYKSGGEEKAKLRRLYYAKHFDGAKFQEITIIDWEESDIKKIIFARQATWNQQKGSWDLLNGRIEDFSYIKKNNLIMPPIIDSKIANVDFFQQKTLLLPSTFFEIANHGNDPQKMSLTEARKYLELIIESKNQPQIRLFQVRIQQKLAFPFICMVFAIIGSSIGINYPINRGKGFTICVAIVFSYYLLGFIIGSCGIVGLISPFVAAWLPNFLGWGIGGMLLYNNNY